MHRIAYGPGNFRRRPQKRPGNPGVHHAPWRRAGYNSHNNAVNLAYVICLVKAGGDEALLKERNWSKAFGVNIPWLADQFVRLCPEFPAHYTLITGKCWNHTAHGLLHNRVYVCYWTASQNGPRDVYSTEHPRIHPVLKPLLPFAEECYRVGRMPLVLGAKEHQMSLI